MGVNSLPKTVTRQRRDCDLNPGPSAPEFRTLTTRLPLGSRPHNPARDLGERCKPSPSEVVAQRLPKTHFAHFPAQNASVGSNLQQH